MKKTYVIQFNDSTAGDSTGVYYTNKRIAIADARYILRNRDSYVDDYVGGTISVYCEDEGTYVWERIIK